MRAPRPHTASHGLPQPLTASHFCHVICLSQSGEHGLSRTRPLRSVRPWESEVRSDSGQGSMILGPVWLISRLNALPRSVESDRPLTHTARSPIALRTLTASQIGLSLESHVICRRVRSASHGLTDLRVRSASHGWPAVRVRSSGQSHLYRAKQPDGPEDRTLTAGQPWEADRTLKSVRPIRLSNLWGRVRLWEADRTLRSDSLTDLTLCLTDLTD